MPQFRSKKNILRQLTSSYLDALEVKHLSLLDLHAANKNLLEGRSMQAM
jgi:hypothetical protein